MGRMNHNNDMMMGQKDKMPMRQNGMMMDKDDMPAHQNGMTKQDGTAKPAGGTD